MANTYDITLGGYKLRLNRMVETGGTRPYRKRWQRQLVQDQNVGLGARKSRFDTAVFFQTDWSGGARWEIPVVDTGDNRYGTASNFESADKPGYLEPANNVHETSDTNLMADSPLVMYNQRMLAFGATQVNNTPNRDMYGWLRGSNSFGRLTYDIGTSSQEVWGAVADVANQKVYFLGGTSFIYEFDPVTPTAGATLIGHGMSIGPSSNLVIHNGRLMVWNGNFIKEVEDRTGTPAMSTAIANDGMGRCLLRQLSSTPSAKIAGRHTLRTCIATSEGVYYVKNVMRDGQPLPWVYRLDRDSGGTDILTPVGTLPAGVLAVSLGWHLGSPVIAATPDWQLFLDNDNTFGECRIDLYTYTQGSLSVIGRIQGRGVDETPYAILGSEGSQLFLGGKSRIWIYDAARGGIHPWLKDAGNNNTPYRFAGRHFDSDDVPVTLMLGSQRYLRVESPESIDPVTVTNFGDDLTTYTLESAAFDFQLPQENKTLSKVSINTDALTGNQKYYVYVQVDGGSWTEVLTHTSGNDQEEDLLSSPITGKRFRYKIVYETKTATRKDLRSIVFTAEPGELVPVWSFVVDGNQILNIENEIQDPAVVYDNFEALALNQAPTTLVDNYRSDQLDDTSTHNVKIDSIEIFKQWSGEAEIHMQVVGVGTEDGVP